MLEHPLTEEQQGGESPRQEGVPDTPSSDGPETVQCPERPTRQPSERLEIQREYLHASADISFLILHIWYFVQSVARPRLDREGELFGCPSNSEQTSSSTEATLRSKSEDFKPKARSDTMFAGEPKPEATCKNST